eukprot:TRINITY_DN79767_c0_g1_i1.p1 TRINITY_DN79767_c0_g1~~TRINITY_DN79767_c0_g1_i1.p1  ORF type:complete len:370 (+),score=59.61 TRINITY_DN79767_c0_g1_i1:58-1167(+)
MDPAPLLTKGREDDNTEERRELLLRAGALVISICISSALCLGASVFASAQHPIILSHAVLSFTLGLRHAVDCDHLAAIDNVTRQLLKQGQQPISVGFWFALGHSSVVLIVTGVVATGYSAVWSAETDNMDLKEDVSMFAAVISVALLCALGLLNAKVALGLFDTWSKFKRGGDAEQQDELLTDHAQASLRSALTALPCIEGILRRVDRPSKMSWVGLVFGLSFDTASQITLIGLSAMSGSSDKLSPAVVMLFPLSFSCGMCLVDTLNGQLMLMTYSWATISPMQKLFYNFVVTAMSACIALFISLLEFLQIVAREAGLKGRMWLWIQGVDMGTLGFCIIGSFAAVFAIAVSISRCKMMFNMDVNETSGV